MIALLCALLAQELGTEILEKKPDVRLLLKLKGTELDPVVAVRRRVATARDTTLGESWAEVSAGLADGGRGQLRAEVTLLQPGTYRVYLGAAVVQVRVSRTDLRSWKTDVNQLRDTIRRLEEIADDIDQAGTPSAVQTARLRRRLKAERERVRRLTPEFHATLRALEEAVDRLDTFRTLVGLVSRPETVKEYEGRPIDQARGDETARAELKSLREVLTREGALLLLEELALTLPPPPPDPGEVRVVRWREPEEAVEAIRKALGEVGPFPAIEAILKDARDGVDPEALRLRVEKERGELLKP